jgi:regulator of nucleoside diphosphate kinase
MRRDSRIVITGIDVQRLRAILSSCSKLALDREHLLDLRDELEQARVVGMEELPEDVVTLESRVRVRDTETGVCSDYTVVTPSEADVSAGHISVLAPLGTALLGYREGDEVEWQMPGGVRHLRIEKVRQPDRPHPGVTEAAHAAVAPAPSA